MSSLISLRLFHVASFLYISLAFRPSSNDDEFFFFFFFFFFCYGKEWLLSFKLRLALAEMKATKETKAERN
jgi:hypothetical protein